MKIIISAFILTALLTSCSGKNNDADNKNVIQTPAIKETTAKPILFIGDSCEYAKQAFIRAHQEYERHIGNEVLLRRQQEARLAIEAVCNSGDKENSGVWACAEGHSCR